MTTEGYLLDLEEEYLAAEEVPRWSDRRA
ncbi:MAG: hypothetical protein QOD14_2240, partial [Solirubrobacterales bacterium]|nr:hypothetical protein [Solirubrobacterales bacterium]